MRWTRSLIVMAEPDRNRGEEGFASAEGRSELGFEQERPRKIIHVDMDALYASVEQRDNPALRGKPATATKMKELGILTALDLRAKDEAFLLKHLGKAGRHFYCICRGIDHRPVLPNRIRKSVGAENTFSRDLTSLDDMRA